MVYEMAQLPDDNVHDAGLNVPPAPLSLHMTEPDVMVGEFDVSLTCAENVTVLPADSIAEVGVTMMVVVWIVLVAGVTLLVCVVFVAIDVVWLLLDGCDVFVELVVELIEEVVVVLVTGVVPEGVLLED